MSWQLWMIEQVKDLTGRHDVGGGMIVVAESEKRAFELARQEVVGITREEFYGGSIVFVLHVSPTSTYKERVVIFPREASYGGSSPQPDNS